MNRLTKKTPLGDYIFIDGEKTCPNEVATKLGKLEDVEEKLKIDLSMLLNSEEVYYYCNRNGEYDTNKSFLINRCEIKKSFRTLIDLEEKAIVIFENGWDDYGTRYPLKHYGITWSLDKNELTKKE